jgi:hypothetical protein
MASRNDDDDDYDRDPPRRRRRDRDDDYDDDEDDRPRRRRRRRDDDDYDYDPRPAAAATMGAGNEVGLALGIVGLVLGTVSLLFAFIPCLGMYALWPAIAATLISVGGLFCGPGARVLSIIAVVISLGAVGLAIYERMRVDRIVEDVRQFGNDMQERDRQRQDRKGN